MSNNNQKPISIDLTDSDDSYDDSSDEYVQHGNEKQHIKDDTYYLEIVQQIDQGYTYKTKTDFLDRFVHQFKQKVDACTLEKQGVDDKFCMYPVLILKDLKGFFDRPCEIHFSFESDKTTSKPKVSIAFLRNTHKTKVFENEELTDQTLKKVFDYLLSEYVPSYFLAIGNPFFTLNITRNLFIYCFALLNPSYEIQKTELGFDIIPFPKFKYIGQRISFRFWVRTLEEKPRFVIHEDTLDEIYAMDLPKGFDIDHFVIRFEMEVAKPEKNKCIRSFSLFSYEIFKQELEYFSAIIQKYIPRFTAEQFNFVNIFSKLRLECDDVLGARVDLAISKAFRSVVFTPEEREEFGNILKKYKDQNYKWDV